MKAAGSVFQSLKRSFIFKSHEFHGKKITASYQECGFIKVNVDEKVAEQRILTYLVLPSPECATLSSTLTLNDLEACRHALCRRHLALHVPSKIDIGHVSLDLTRMQSKDCGTASFPLQLSGHVAKHLIEGCLGGAICGEAILEVAKLLSRARVAGDERDFVDGKAALQELLSADDGSYGVRMEVEGEVFVAGLDGSLILGISLAKDVDKERCTFGYLSTPALRITLCMCLTLDCCNRLAKTYQGTLAPSK